MEKLLEKLGLLINGGINILSKKLDSLSSELKNQKEPIINVSPPEVNVNVPEIKVPEVNIPEIKVPEIKFPDYPEFPEIPAPIVNVPEAKAPVVNVPAPIVNIEAPVVNVESTPINFPDKIKIEGIDKIIKNTEPKEEKEEKEFDVFKNVSSKKTLPVSIIVNGKEVKDFGGDMSAPSIVGLKNNNSSVGQINPATEDKQSDTLIDYKLSDIEDATTTYLGYLRKDGAWYISKITDTQVRYVKGANGYDFSNRASETYNTFNNIF